MIRDASVDPTLDRRVGCRSVLFAVALTEVLTYVASLLLMLVALRSE